jgi:hypothetical protein
LIADATKKELLEKEAAETDCQIENTVSDNWLIDWYATYQKGGH